MNSNKILVVDDHQVVVMGILQMFHKHGVAAEVTDVCDLEDAYKLLGKQHFDLVILDINVRNGNKPSMIGAIRRIQPEIHILVYSGCDESLYGYPYLQAGASGFLAKSASDKEFVHAVSRVLKGEQYLSTAMLQQVISKVVAGPVSGLHSLTSREIEILQYLMKGASITKIGEELFLHTSTVSTHKTKIFKKLGVSNVAEMIDYVKLNMGSGGLAG
jgi:two-component system invasion response regulator UvrY